MSIAAQCLKENFTMCQKLRFITIRKLAFSNTIFYHLIYLFNRMWIKWLRTLRTLTTLNKKSLINSLDHQNHVNHSAQTYKNFIGRLFFLWLELVAYFFYIIHRRDDLQYDQEGFLLPLLPQDDASGS
ncbi:unnamed protein product [Rhizophagus irregularis]|nr:unnamed protein product [Rhizophagus irregularis]